MWRWWERYLRFSFWQKCLFFSEKTRRHTLTTHTDPGLRGLRLRRRSRRARRGDPPRGPRRAGGRARPARVPAQRLHPGRKTLGIISKAVMRKMSLRGIYILYALCAASHSALKLTLTHTSHSQLTHTHTAHGRVPGPCVPPWLRPTVRVRPLTARAARRRRSQPCYPARGRRTGAHGHHRPARRRPHR